MYTNLSHLLIFYIDEENELTSYFLGFSIYISNTTDKTDGQLCFKDDNYTRATIPNPITIPCIHRGRYVFYYNNRTHSPIPVGYSTDVFTGICELEVHGNKKDLKIIVLNKYMEFLIYWSENMLINLTR